MIKLGSDVRLRNGWTRLVVIDVLNNGKTVRAKYDNPEWPVASKDFKDPQCSTGTLVRGIEDFVLWDGLPGAYRMNEEFNMTQRYKSCAKATHNVTGMVQGKTSSGLLILEDELSGDLHSVRPEEIEKIVPFTIRVRSASNHNYVCHYTLPSDAPDLYLDDVLVSKSGNMYIVTDIDTKNNHPKGMFRGKRMAVDAEFG